MLYLDQPVQVGFSYDVLASITNNLETGDITILNSTDSVPDQSNTFLVGTYPSQDAIPHHKGARMLQSHSGILPKSGSKNFLTIIPMVPESHSPLNRMVVDMDQPSGRFSKNRTRRSKMVLRLIWAICILYTSIR